jgi:uncharacterized protein YkwD
MLSVLVALLSINAVRIDAGLMPVHWDAELAQHARAHAVVMSTSGLHHSDLGPLIDDRLWVAENVGVCRGCNDVPLSAYMDSPSHRDNVLSPRATTFGTAEVSDGTNTWDVQVFGQDDREPLPRYAVLYLDAEHPESEGG